MNTMTIEDTFGRLKFEFDQKTAEIKALATQQKASADRLDDFLTREGEAKAAWQKASTALDQANKELTQAKRDAAKIISDARADADRIRSEAHVAADGFLRGVQSAVQAAASLIKHKHKETE
jgi:hypothetical protein